MKVFSIRGVVSVSLHLDEYFRCHYVPIRNRSALERKKAWKMIFNGTENKSRDHRRPVAVPDLSERPGDSPLVGDDVTDPPLVAFL